MTLEKPPRGKSVKRKCIMELEGIYYSRDLLQPTYLNLATNSSLKIEPTLP
jgi:hypothetical protein